MSQRDPDTASEWLDVVMEEVRRKREEAAEQQPAPTPAPRSEDEPPDTAGDKPRHNP